MRTPRLPVVDWTDVPRRFKWTRTFRRKTKSGFCACAITVQLTSTTYNSGHGFAALTHDGMTVKLTCRAPSCTIFSRKQTNRRSVNHGALTGFCYHDIYIYIYIYRYTRITFTKSPSICVTAFSPSLTNHEALLPRSPLAPPPRWFQQHTDLRSHEFRHSAHLWHQPRLANVTCA